ncbi:MAG TPA: DUF134 domain-containing protein [Candidatus Fermentibacter daniensis]|nr:DUF134 domain-containing protein [Candidatus Fermentibacter daniensis]HOR06344.1 DUF134 domain-containing protein [Candidatus Fermentibacter daniensis]HOZ17947.1 DUF134 domain-containing protein [Candidatus Fermentibacter daniensis]HPH39670.1 DUF134 domain-containing protein [Candidatus Fermentibacter daniensis]HPK51948.1 DUF134 domain-containing protein [Candidatus Fermentibacter daniensis]
MPRPRCRCRISHCVGTGQPAHRKGPAAEAQVLTPEEVEALRLADLEGLYFEQAASAMGVSRATFGRIAGRARRKVAAAVVFGMPISVGPGDSRSTDGAPCGCSSCRRLSETSPCTVDPGESRPGRP